jgi:DNA modification methylase
VHRGDALRFAERLPPAAFDVAFTDPPYSHDTAARLVALFRRTPFARILSVEHSADLSLPGDGTRRYGDTALTFCYSP